jgi:hypothetical protein
MQLRMRGDEMGKGALLAVRDRDGSGTVTRRTCPCGKPIEARRDLFGIDGYLVCDCGETYGPSGTPLGVSSGPAVHDGLFADAAGPQWDGARQLRSVTTAQVRAARSLADAGDVRGVMDVIERMADVIRRVSDAWLDLPPDAALSFREQFRGQP